MQKAADVALVVGGAGFIGSHLLRQLAAEGRYSSLVSADIAEPRFRVDGVDYRHVDIREPLPLDLCPGVPAIFNLAAVHTTPGHQDWEYYWTNVLGAVHVCDYARQVGTREIVFTSSISVYGPTDSQKDENSLLEPATAYGRSKLAAEKIHRTWFSERPDRKLVIARPAAVYGLAERGNFTRLASLLSKRRFAYPGRKDTIKACGYVEDLLGTFTFMLARPEPLVVYNFSHPERFTSEDICAAFANVGGFAAKAPVIPISLMLVAATIFEALQAVGIRTSINRSRVRKLYDATDVYPRQLVEMTYPYKFTLETALAHWHAVSNGKFD